MALSTTYVAGAVTSGATGVGSTISVAAFTSPATAGISVDVLGRFATGEYVLITGNTGTTLNVVRGYLGSRAVAHSVYEGFQYGLATEAWPAAAAQNIQIAPVSPLNVQEVTLTGTTGTDAAIVTVPMPAFLNLSGASGAGVNLPVPRAGDSIAIKNSGSGTTKIYCVGGSINGTSGTTAVSVTSTGILGGTWFCATAGAWQTAPLPGNTA